MAEADNSSGPNSCNKSEKIIIPSLQHHPGPWFGWNGEGVLRAVVINYNPYSGGNKPANGKDFKDCVCDELTNGVPYRKYSARNTAAEAWHRACRLNQISELLKPKIEISNYLCLEFSPFPSSNSGSVIDFVKANPGVVKKYVLEFASEASKIIEGGLKNIVFVRVSNYNFREFLRLCGLKCEELKAKEMPVKFKKSKETEKEKSSDKLKGYGIKEFPDTKFIVVTGVRNQFPKLKFINNKLNKNK